MAELPAQEFRWSSSTVDETVEINGINVLVTNKVEPDESFKNTGILARQPVPRSRVNWAFNLIGMYITHLIEKDAVGTIHLQDTNESNGDVSTRLGGSWVQLGTTSMASTTLYVYRKDSM